MTAKRLLHAILLTLSIGLLPMERSDAEVTTLSGRVVAVHDGDTITILDSYRRQFRIRLHQIDAPEKAQDYGASSKRSLSSLIFRREVLVDAVTVDRYHRIVGKVRYGGYDINLEQVARGMAWVYRRYGHDERYIAAEDAARRSRIGLWAKSKPVPPWEFRKEERDEGNAFDPRRWFGGRR